MIHSKPKSASIRLKPRTYYVVDSDTGPAISICIPNHFENQPNSRTSEEPENSQIGVKEKDLFSGLLVDGMYFTLPEAPLMSNDYLLVFA